MKTFFIAAALIVGTPVLAQDMPASPPAAGPAATPDAMTPPAAPAAPDATAAPAAPAAPAATAAPAFTPTPVDSASLPTCSKKITDKCINPGAKKKK